MTNSSRAGISSIFKRHFQTFYNYERYRFTNIKKAPASDILTFLVIPGGLSLAITVSDPDFISGYSELIVSSLSIFAGLLFSLLVLVFDVSVKEKNRLAEKPNYIGEAEFTLSKEIFYNVSYAIALSILAITAIFLSHFRPERLIGLLKMGSHFQEIRWALTCLVNCIILFLLLQFGLTLLMVLKRFFIIFENQMDR